MFKNEIYQAIPVKIIHTITPLFLIFPSTGLGKDSKNKLKKQKSPSMIHHNLLSDYDRRTSPQKNDERSDDFAMAEKQTERYLKLSKEYQKIEQHHAEDLRKIIEAQADAQRLKTKAKGIKQQVEVAQEIPSSGQMKLMKQFMIKDVDFRLNYK